MCIDFTVFCVLLSKYFDSTGQSSTSVLWINAKVRFHDRCEFVDWWTEKGLLPVHMNQYIWQTYIHTRSALERYLNGNVGE
jgi:hypothetical protein